MSATLVNEDIFTEKLVTSGYYGIDLQKCLNGILIKELQTVLDNLRNQTANVFQCEDEHRRFIPRWRISNPSDGCDVIVDCRKKTNDSPDMLSSIVTNDDLSSVDNEILVNASTSSSEGTVNRKDEIIKLTEVDIHDNVTNKITYICPDKERTEDNFTAQLPSSSTTVSTFQKNNGHDLEKKKISNKPVISTRNSISGNNSSVMNGILFNLPNQPSIANQHFAVNNEQQICSTDKNLRTEKTVGGKYPKRARTLKNIPTIETGTNDNSLSHLSRLVSEPYLNTHENKNYPNCKQTTPNLYKLHRITLD